MHVLLVRAGMCASKISRASGISAGCATQVPSWPALTSRSLSARTRASARCVGRVVAGDRDLRRHAAHRVRAAAVAGLDQQFRIRLQERLRHRHLAALGQHLVAMRAEGLEVRKDVVPAPAVEAGDARAQRVQDLVHLERGRQRLDQHRDLHLPVRQAERALRCARARRPTAPLPPSTAAWAGRSTGRDPSPRARCALWKANRPRSNSDADIGTPSTRRCFSSRCQPRGRTISTACSANGFERVVLAAVRRHPVERAGDGLAQRALAGEQVGPGRRRSSPRSRPCSTCAPELSALMTIFGSTGPVISTRRSSSAGGSSATRQSAARMRGGVGAEVGQGAGVEAGLAREAVGQPRPGGPARSGDAGRPGRPAPAGSAGVPGPAAGG